MIGCIWDNTAVIGCVLDDIALIGYVLDDSAVIGYVLDNAAVTSLRYQQFCLCTIWVKGDVVKGPQYLGIIVALRKCLWISGLSSKLKREDWFILFASLGLYFVPEMVKKCSELNNEKYTETKQF